MNRRGDRVSQDHTPMTKLIPLLFALIPLAAVATAYVVAP
jgi:hypothetical protein